MRTISIALILLLLSCNQKPNPTVNWPPMSPEWNELQVYVYIDAGLNYKD